MSFTAERIYELLPAIHRMRDAERGGPLRALLDVVADQVAVLEENIAQLYDDEFVETCAPWVLPYIGDLLGITGLPGAPLSSRAEVANTIGYRRRKGTAGVLERLARDITGLPARAVEYFQVLVTTQNLKHLRPQNRGVLSLRDALRLEELGGPFEHLAGEMDIQHTGEVRRIPPRRGRYNIPNIGLFLWRLCPYGLTRSPAVPDTPGDQQRFRFSPLGTDAPLFRLPITEDEPTQLAAPLNVPGRISRRWLDAHVPDEYGDDRSFYIEQPGAGPGGSLLPVAAGAVVACDLEGWLLPGWTAPPAGEVHVDPVLGRVAFGDAQAQPPLVSFHYGFSADVGGGEYNRRIPTEETAPITVGTIRPGDHATIPDALAALPAEGGVVEILDSGRYAADFAIAAAGRQVTVRAADGFRPTVVLTNDLHISGDADGAVTLDGLLVLGAGVVVDASGPGHLRVRHCTLVPRAAPPAEDGSIAAVPSLTIASVDTQVAIESSIVGAVRAVLDADVEATTSISARPTQARSPLRFARAQLTLLGSAEFIPLRDRPSAKEAE